MIGECVVGIRFFCCELAGDDGSIFFCCLSSGEGCGWSVVGSSQGDFKGAVASGIGTIGDGVVNGDGLFLSFGEGVVGVNGRIERPGAIGADGETVNGVGAREGVGQRFVGINVGCCELTDESDAAF